MEGFDSDRTASDMPGLDDAEQKSWEYFLESALQLQATLNQALIDEHDLTLNDVRLLSILDKFPTGSVRMGDLAAALRWAPPRVTRQIRRLEPDLVRRGTSPDDARVVIAIITGAGRDALREAMETYGDGVRAHFLGKLSRPQIAVMGENCRRISVGLKKQSAPHKLSAMSG